MSHHQNAKALTAIATLGLTCLFSSNSYGAIEKGDLFIVETAAQKIFNIKAGGDVSATTAFAYYTGTAGNHEPVGLCVGPKPGSGGGSGGAGGSGGMAAGGMGGAGGSSAGTPERALYASFINASDDYGEVKIITDGGEVSSVAAHATWSTTVAKPYGLWCDDQKVLVADEENNMVVDITQGGDYSSAQGFAYNIPKPVAIHRDANGKLWVSTRLGKIFDITAGGDMSSASPFVTSSGAPLPRLGGMTYYDNKLLVAKVYQPSLNGTVLDVTSGGTINDNMIFYANSGTQTVFSVEGLGLFVTSQINGDVFKICSPGSSCDAQPSGGGGGAGGMAGMGGMAGAGGMAAGGMGGMGGMGGAGGGIPTDPQWFGRVGTFGSNNARPHAMAYVHGCGDGVVLAGVEECDDGNNTDGDGCSSLCLTEATGSGGAGGMAGSGGATGTGGSSSSQGGSAAGSGGSSGTGGLTPPTTGDDAACTCKLALGSSSSSKTPWSALGLLMLGFVAALRRRSRDH